MLPAGGDEKTWPTTAAVKRPCPTNPIRKKQTYTYEYYAGNDVLFSDANVSFLPAAYGSCPPPPPAMTATLPFEAFP